VKDRTCRVCGLEVEEWKHVWEECGRWGAIGNWEDMVEMVLGEEGEGESWLRRLEEFRGGVEGREFKCVWEGTE